MRRFFLSGLPDTVGDEVELSDELRKHLYKVLRLPAGTEVLLQDGCGKLARAVLQPGTNARLLEISHAAPPPVALSLIQGLPKGEKIDLVLQKGTELGVGEFVLAQMERSIGRIKGERLDKRLQRWQKIVQEAARQCAQPWLPQLATTPSLSVAVQESTAEVKLMLWEEGSRPLPELLPVQAPESISVIVGPEGGISAQEAEIAASAGYRAVRLGPRILRTETAGLAIMSILQYLYGDLRNFHTRDSTTCEGKDTP